MNSIEIYATDVIDSGSEIISDSELAIGNVNSSEQTQTALLNSVSRESIAEVVTIALSDNNKFSEEIKKRVFTSDRTYIVDVVVTDFEIFRQSFQRYSETDEYIKAVNSFIEGELQDFYQFAGELCVERNKLDTAIYYYKKSCLLGTKKSRWGLHCLSSCYQWKGDYAKAIIASYLTLCVDPDNELFVNQFTKLIYTVAGQPEFSKYELTSNVERLYEKYSTKDDMEVGVQNKINVDRVLETLQDVSRSHFDSANIGIILYKIINSEFELEVGDDNKFINEIEFYSPWVECSNFVENAIRKDLYFVNNSSINLADWSAISKITNTKIYSENNLFSFVYGKYFSNPKLSSGNPLLVVALSEFAGIRLEKSVFSENTVLHENELSNQEIGYFEFLENENKDLDLSTTKYFDSKYFRSQCLKSCVETSSESNIFLQYIHNPHLYGLNTHKLIDACYIMKQTGNKESPPLLQYLNFKGSTKLSPNSIIDVDFINENNECVSSSSVEIINSYFTLDRTRRSGINRYFDAFSYKHSNQDIGDSCPNLHFLHHGFKEGREPNLFFSEQYVLNKNKDCNFSVMSEVDFYLQNEREKTKVLLVLPDLSNKIPAQKALAIATYLMDAPSTSVYVLSFRGGELFNSLRNVSHLLCADRLTNKNKEIDPEENLQEIYDFLSITEIDETVYLSANVASFFEPKQLSHGKRTLLISEDPKKQASVLLGRVHDWAESTYYLCADDYLACKKMHKKDRSHFIDPNIWLSKNSGTGQQNFTNIENVNGLINIGVIVSDMGEFSSSAILRMSEYFSGSPNVSLRVYSTENTQTKGSNEVTHLTNVDGLFELKHSIDVDSEDSIYSNDFILLTNVNRNSREQIVSCMSAGAIPIIPLEASAYEDIHSSKACISYDIFDLKKGLQAISELLDSNLEMIAFKNRCIEFTTREKHSQLLGSIWYKPEINIQASNNAKNSLKTILFLNSDWSVSGVNTFTEHLARSLIMKGYDVKIVFTRGKYGKYPENDFMPGVPTVFLNPKKTQPWYRGIFDALKEYVSNYDNCIVVPNYDFVASCTSSSLPDNVGIVGIAHSDDVEHYEHVYRLGHWWNHIVTVSETIKKNLLEYNRSFTEKTSTVYYGIPEGNRSYLSSVTAKHQATDSCIRLIYTGRLILTQKRVDRFFHLCKYLDQMQVNYHLDIVGDGPLEAKMSEYFLDNSKVTIHGRLSKDEIDVLLKKAHVFTMLSDFEGLPLSLIEALKEGCIPVLNKIESGVCEIIESGVNGLIIDHADMREMAAQIKDLANSKEKRVRIAENAYKTFIEKGLDLNSMRDQYVEIFETVFNEIETKQYKRPESFTQRPVNKGMLLPSWLR